MFHAFDKQEYTVT